MIVVRSSENGAWGGGAIKIDVSKVGAEDKVEAKQFGYKYVVMRPAAPGCRTHVTMVFA